MANVWVKVRGCFWCWYQCRMTDLTFAWTVLFKQLPLCRVHSLRRLKFPAALSQRPVPTPAHSLVRAPLRWRVNFAFALRGSISTSCPASPCSGVSCPCAASPHASGSNSSSSAAVAFSAPPASSPLAVPSARAGVVSMIDSTPPCSYMSIPEGLISLALVFVTAHARPRQSGLRSCQR